MLGVNCALIMQILCTP